MGSSNSYASLEQTMKSMKLGHVETLFFFSFGKSMECIYKEHSPSLQNILSCLARIQSYVDADCVYPVYRFGCALTRDQSVLGLDGGNEG